ncbi:MAG: transposase, partial [bacterium]|nr:transposase [bacterium]
MPNLPIPESLDSVLQPFDSCFSRASFANFKLLVIGWILCRRRRWITRVVYASGGLGYRHISAFYRFFTSAPWDPDPLGRRLLNQLINLLPETVEAMVDDTLCRRSGPHIFGISMHHDGTASSYGTGASGKYSN